MGLHCIVVKQCDLEVRYHMAMKSSGLAVLWKPHPSPDERHGAETKQWGWGGGLNNKIIDYDNHHLNQIPSTLPSSPATLPHLSLLFHPTPGYSAFLAEHSSEPPANPPTPPPPSITHIHTQQKSLESARRQKPTYAPIRVCVCVFPPEMLSTLFQDVELYTCIYFFFYQHIRARLHASLFLRTFSFE